MVFPACLESRQMIRVAVPENCNLGAEGQPPPPAPSWRQLNFCEYAHSFLPHRAMGLRLVPMRETVGPRYTRSAST